MGYHLVGEDEVEGFEVEEVDRGALKGLLTNELSEVVVKELDCADAARSFTVQIIENHRLRGETNMKKRKREDVFIHVRDLRPAEIGLGR